jgi:hypothetical protein
MRGKSVVAGIAMVIGGVLAPVGNVRAQDEPFPVELQVGETFDACASGQIVCPARAPICDDPNVAVPADVSGGLGFKGIGPGSTLCSAASAVGPRRIFRVTVR